MYHLSLWSVQLALWFTIYISSAALPLCLSTICFICHHHHHPLSAIHRLYCLFSSLSIYHHHQSANYLSISSIYNHHLCHLWLCVTYLYYLSIIFVIYHHHHLSINCHLSIPISSSMICPSIHPSISMIILMNIIIVICLCILSLFLSIYLSIYFLYVHATHWFCYLESSNTFLLATLVVL